MSDTPQLIYDVKTPTHDGVGIQRNGIVTVYRTQVFTASQNELTGTEKDVIALVERIKELEAERDAAQIVAKHEARRADLAEAERDALVAALHTSNELHKEVHGIVYQSNLEKGDRLQRIAVRIEHLVPQPQIKRTHHG